MARFTPRTTEREMRSAWTMVGHKRERVLGRVGRAVDAAARDLAREAAQLENGGGREAAAERLVKQQVEVVALDSLALGEPCPILPPKAGFCMRRLERDSCPFLLILTLLFRFCLLDLILPVPFPRTQPPGRIPHPASVSA